MKLRCVDCGIKACSAEPGAKSFPPFCPESQPEGKAALERARQAYQDDETRALARAAAQTEADRYPLETRVEEVMSFARRIGATHLGIATCMGLIRESRVFAEILVSHGFEVDSVCCKAGNVPKEELGVTDEEKIRPGQFEAMCSPIAQAELLNAAGTQLNVAVGLCVGHDSLFFRHSEAPVTVLVAKDRVTGHSPAAVLYTSSSYYSRLKGDQ